MAKTYVDKNAVYIISKRIALKRRKVGTEIVGFMMWDGRKEKIIKKTNFYN